MEESKELLTEQKDGVGTLTIHRPERRNALSPELLMRLHRTLQAWALEESVRVVVITGAGDRAFSSGYDILAMPTGLVGAGEAILEENNPLELAFKSLRHYPYPTIAMLNGSAFGAGLNLAVCCDLRIGADDIKAGMPPAKLGVVYPPEGLKLFVEVLGMARTKEVFFSGRVYRGSEVKDAGLVDRLVKRADLKTVTYELAHEIAGNAPLALKGIKRILNMLGDEFTLSDYERREAEELVARAFNSRDLKEGQAAFLEKREPRFVGE
ncbi:MAG: enoyl-CoA hydratase/isomerase family protein [Thermodesulfobacteriota bacterium]